MKTARVLAYYASGTNQRTVVCEVRYRNKVHWSHALNGSLNDAAQIGRNWALAHSFTHVKQLNDAS